jgi:MoxR-like ATPase
MNPKIAPLIANVSRAVRGKEEAIRLAVICLLGRGHLLIEDVPGVGKTTLASALASSVGCTFQRIQLTSDLLPSDILGTMIYDPQSRNFELKPGPLFHQIVLVDEINRGMPRTQSALLEAMNEAQVSLDSRTYPLPEPFMVLATQNPAEFAGTFPLPESQLDRFLMRITLGYPSRQAEREVLLGTSPPKELEPVMSAGELLELQRKATEVRVEASLLDYILDIVEATRRSPAVSLGASPRAAKALYRAAQATALLEGQDYVVPRHIKELCVPVLAHRILLAEPSGAGAATRQAEETVRALAEEVTVPL